MSCNGCRVLRRGCSDECILRPCLDWIQNPQAQSNATLFVSKFFGRSDLMSFISSVPENKRSALFQSLLYEACGRTVNPVNGAVGLLSSGNWHVCQAAVETVLGGGTPPPIYVAQPSNGGEASSSKYKMAMHGSDGVVLGEMKTASFGSGLTEEFVRGGSDQNNGVKKGGVGSNKPKLLNLFA